MDKTKLVELRKKRQQNKTKEKQARQKHDASVLGALRLIHSSLLKGEKYSAENTQKLLKELKTIAALNKNFERLEKAIKNIPAPEATETVTVDNLPNFAELVPEYDNTEVVNAIDALREGIINNKAQKAEDFLPIRRVRKVGNQYIFDDSPWVGGGGGVVSSPSQPVYTTLVADDSGDSNITYVGEALPGTATSAPSWRIQKIDSTSGTSVTFSSGSTKFISVWDNREELSYA